MFQWRNKRYLYILIFCLDNALSLNLSNVWPFKFYTSPKQTGNNSDDDDDGLKINDTVVIESASNRKRERDCVSMEVVGG